LDKALGDVDQNNNEPDFDPVGSVLAEVPSTQPETPPKRLSRESRPREWTSCPREDTRQVVLTRTPGADERKDGATSVVSPNKGKIPQSSPHKHKSRHEKGRGILCLPAPPKVGDWPVAERRPSYHGEMLSSQWSIHVPQAPTVEFTASTPPLEDSQLFTSQSDTSQFQDADEDYRPLIGTWANIVERQEQASSAAAAAVSAALATLPAPVAAINAAASNVSAGGHERLLDGAYRRRSSDGPAVRRHLRRNNSSTAPLHWWSAPAVAYAMPYGLVSDIFLPKKKRVKDSRSFLHRVARLLSGTATTTFLSTAANSPP